MLAALEKLIALLMLLFPSKLDYSSMLQLVYRFTWFFQRNFWNFNSRTGPRRLCLLQLLAIRAAPGGD